MLCFRFNEAQQCLKTQSSNDNKLIIMIFQLENHYEVQKYKWQFKEHPHIKITDKKQIVNTKTGRKLKLCVNGYSVGVWIGGKFITNPNNHIEKISTSKIPF